MDVDLNYLNLWKIPKNLNNSLVKFNNKMVTRFPPEPSGYLHLGHAKACFINYVLAKRFNGKMILRFDDTNPLKEDNEYEIAIKEDLNKLEIYPDKITHTSDYFEKIMEYADHLIKIDKAYVDNSDQQMISETRIKGMETENRSNSIEKNIKIWNEMKFGLQKDYCLRIKMNMNHKNMTCRDPIIYRYIEKEHHNTGDKFKIFPTYDFSCPIVDYLEEITHVFRSGFNERDEQYNLILELLNLKKPNLLSYGKVNFQEMVMGKRKIKELIDKKVVDGWDDPRLLTIRGLFNKGMQLDPLRQFIAKIGFSKNATNMTQDMIWSLNKKYIDKFSMRYMVLPKDKLVEFNINLKNEIQRKNEIYKFIKNKNLGKREIHFDNIIYLNIDETINFKEGEEITLLNWCNAFLINKNYLELNLNGNFKMTDKKILWISKGKNVTVKIITYNGITEQPKINYYIGEYDMLNLKINDYVQLIKMNYYKCLNINFDENEVHLMEIC